MENQNRTMKTYPFPKSLGGGTVTMKQISFGDFNDAIRNAEGSPARLTMELAKRAIVAVDGKKVDPFDPTFEVWWQKLAHPARQLIVGGHNELNNATDEETKFFMAGVEEAATPQS